MYPANETVTFSVLYGSLFLKKRVIFIIVTELLLNIGTTPVMSVSFVDVARF